MPSNVVLHRVGARRWIARTMVSWGVVAAAMAFANSPVSFYLLRFLLGVAEAGFIPGAVMVVGGTLVLLLPARLVNDPARRSDEVATRRT